MVLAFLFGEGVEVARLTPVEWVGMAAMATLCVGLLLGWKREMAGAMLALLALVVLYAVELAASGRLLSGWVWPLLGLLAALYLIVDAAGRRLGHQTFD